jgi:hypothetical protein
MADSFISKLRQSASAVANAVKEAGEWFKGVVSGRDRRDPTQVFSKDASPDIGQMYLFVYDPKHKATLPFYDAYPLVFPIEFYGDGFLAINLHYLPPGARAALMDDLAKFANNDKYDETTRLNLSYRILKTYSARLGGIENCIKRYLYSHVRSQFHQIDASDWGQVVMLPLQRWVVNPNRRYAGSPPY